MDPKKLDGAIRKNQREKNKKPEAHFDKVIQQMFDSYSF
jgi:hypothetical protein